MCCLLFKFNGLAAAPATTENISATVSGLSGGAFFATQFHVAHSAIVHGAGILAGGPYYCAEDSLLLAEGRCMRLPADISVEALVAITEATFETTRTIDAPANLATHRVWMLSATSDSVVARGVVEKLHDYYAHFLRDPATQLSGVFNESGEHAFLTVADGSPCLYKGEPFINACGYDAAGALLQHLYSGELVTPHADAAPSGLGGGDGKLLQFAQNAFLPVGWALEAAALGELGYVYVPSACKPGNSSSSSSSSSAASSCRVHAAFHGCEQTVHDIGLTYMLETGLGKW